MTNEAKSVSRDEYLKLLGDILVNFNTLEFFVSHSIWKNIGHEKDLLGGAVTSHLDFEGKIQTLRSLYRVNRSADKFKDFSKVYTVLKSVQEKRNIYLHSEWNLTNETRSNFKELFRKLKEGKNPAESHESISIIELKNFRNELIIAYIKVLKYEYEYESDISKLKPEDLNK